MENVIRFSCLFWGFLPVTKSEVIENILEYFHEDGFVLRGNWKHNGS